MEPGTFVTLDYFSYSKTALLWYTINYKDSGGIAGTIYRIYSVAALSILIEPLYADIGDYELVIYSRWAED